MLWLWSNVRVFIGLNATETELREGLARQKNGRCKRNISASSLDDLFKQSAHSRSQHYSYLQDGKDKEER